MQVQSKLSLTSLEYTIFTKERNRRRSFARSGRFELWTRWIFIIFTSVHRRLGYFAFWLWTRPPFVGNLQSHIRKKELKGCLTTRKNKTKKCTDWTAPNLIVRSKKKRLRWQHAFLANFTAYLITKTVSRIGSLPNKALHNHCPQYLRIYWGSSPENMKNLLMNNYMKCLRT